jgi:hypothetical protein
MDGFIAGVVTGFLLAVAIGGALMFKTFLLDR